MAQNPASMIAPLYIVAPHQMQFAQEVAPHQMHILEAADAPPPMQGCSTMLFLGTLFW